MLQVEWEYFPDNICTDRPVAVLKKKGTMRTILYVYESRTHHVPSTRNGWHFLQLTPISYHEESRIVREHHDEESLSTDEVLTLRLKAGCKLIEEEFLHQADEIIDKLS